MELFPSGRRDRADPESPNISAHQVDLEGTREISSSLTESGVDTVPDNAATDQGPTRQYQILLLLSGFIMIFHVIGINMIYGIFQVSCTTVRTHWSPVLI
jgi:hypothetical protein